MNLFWCFLWTILFSRFYSPTGILSKSTITFCVLPTDIDVLMHMNNGRYFSFLDLARINLMIRNNVFSILKKNGIYPVVASEMIRFKKSLNLFQRFQITTQIIGWDDTFFYIAHQFKRKKELSALCLVKARMLRANGGKISPSAVVQLIDPKLQSPALPNWLEYWLQADKEFYNDIMKNFSN